MSERAADFGRFFFLSVSNSVQSAARSFLSKCCRIRQGFIFSKDREESILLVFDWFVLRYVRM